MKQVVIILLLSVSCFASGCGTGYSFARTVTIDHTTVPATLTNFPFLLQGTFTWTKSVANGGQVQHTGAGFTAPSIPDDLIFCDSPAGNQLPHEVDNYDATTGVAGFWISIPSISSTVDTVIYAYYGKASVSTSQEQATTLWGNAGYVSVYHMTNAAAVSQKDSGPGGNDLSWIGTHDQQTGQVGGAISGGSTVGIANNGSPNGLPTGTAARAIEAWVLFGNNRANNAPYFFGWGSFSCGTFSCTGSGTSWGIGSGEMTGGAIPANLGVYDTPASFTWGDGSGLFSSSGYGPPQAWHKIIGQSAAGNSEVWNSELIVDGAAVATTHAADFHDAINTAAGEIRIGACLAGGNAGAFSCFWGGTVDEARIASTTFSAQWNQYEYCNDTGSCTATIGPPIVADDEPQIFITT